MKNNKSKCQKCKKIYKNKSISFFKGKYLCKNCIRKISNCEVLGSNCAKIEKAQEKIRKVNICKTGNNYLRCSVNLPICYANKKVKVVVVD